MVNVSKTSKFSNASNISNDEQVEQEEREFKITKKIPEHSRERQPTLDKNYDGRSVLYTSDTIIL